MRNASGKAGIKDKLTHFDMIFHVIFGRMGENDIRLDAADEVHQLKNRFRATGVNFQVIHSQRNDLRCPENNSGAPGFFSPDDLQLIWRDDGVPHISIGYDAYRYAVTFL